MKHFIVASVLAWGSTAANAAVTTYTNSADFFAATPTVGLVEDFEDSDFWVRNFQMASYTGRRGAITFTAIASYPFSAPNIILVTTGYEPYWPGPNRPTSIVLAADGNEEWFATLTNPSTALGFDVHLNDAPLSISFFSGGALLTVLNFDADPDLQDHPTFVGITSTTPVTGFHWQAYHGEVFHTGIDNIFAVVPSGVPEPATWLMMLLGFGAIGIARRRRTRAPHATRKRQ
jgi:hypothetical protein